MHRRIDIDIARGLAIYLVVLGHLLDKLPAGGVM